MFPFACAHCRTWLLCLPVMIPVACAASARSSTHRSNAFADDVVAAHWPNQTGDMADTMNGTPKYVVSGTLESADWQNSTLIPAAKAFAEIAELKQQPGQNIGMTGSGTLVSSLLREGLLDELHLFVFPLVAGSGKRLFGASDAQLPLKLLDSATFQSGVVHSTYAKA